MTARSTGQHDLSSHHSKGRRCFSALIEELVLHKGSKLAPSRPGLSVFSQENPVRSIDCNYSSDGIRWNDDR
jgi:hypothetical protein